MKKRHYKKKKVIGYTFAHWVVQEYRFQDRLLGFPRKKTDKYTQWVFPAVTDKAIAWKRPVKVEITIKEV